MGSFMIMRFASTLEEIESSKAFHNFKEKNPDAWLCAGFFVIDIESEGKGNQRQLDYCLSNGKIFTFILSGSGSIQMKEAETLGTETPKEDNIKTNKEETKEKLQKINPEIKVDLDDIGEIVKEKLMLETGKKINKIIAILQKHHDKQIWNLTCMLPGLELLQVQADTENGDILKFEKRNIFEFVKKQ